MAFSMGFLGIVVLTIAALPKLLPIVAAEDDLDWRICKIEFANKDQKIKAIKDCAAKHNFPLKLHASIDEIKEEVKAMKEKDFDDGCFSKCLYEEIHMLEPNGKISLSKIDDFYKGSSASPELVTAIKTAVESCVKDVEAKFKDEKEMPCKMYTMTQLCIFKKFMDNKGQLEELCKQ